MNGTQWDELAERVGAAVPDILGNSAMAPADVASEAVARGLIGADVVETWFDGDLAEVGDWIVDILTDFDDGTWQFPADQRLVNLPQFTDGVVLTHRLTAGELATGRLARNPDFDFALFTSNRRVVGDGVIDHFDDPGYSPPTTLTGPEGWLAGLHEGDVVAITLRAPDKAEFAAVDPGALGDGDREVQALSAAWATLADRHDDGHLGTVEVVAAAFGHDGGIFRRAVPPLTELVARAGFSTDGETAGPADRDWVAHRRAIEARDRARHAQEWGLRDCCRPLFDLLADAVKALDARQPRPESATPEIVGRALTHHTIAPVLAEYVLRGDRWRGALDDLVEPSIGLGGVVEASARYVRARNAERRLDPLAMETDLEAAHRADPDNPYVAYHLALVAADRGDAARAHALLRRSGLPDSGIGDALDAMVNPFAGTGRNEPCPCGSGRRFKQCCLRDPKPDARARVGFLLSRATTFERSLTDTTIDVLGAIAADAADASDDLADLVAGHAFIEDLAIFEGGHVAAYLEARGPLLTDDDRDELERWLSTPRSLWKATATGRGFATLRHHGTGEEVQVTSDSVVAGDFYVARVVPVGEGHVMLGATLAVPADAAPSVAALLAEDPTQHDWARWFGTVLAGDDDDEDEAEDA